MAIAATHLTTSGNTTDTTVYTTASITPSANALVLAWVGSPILSGTPPTPTLAGCSLTWVEVTTVLFGTIAAPLNRLTLFRAMGASPTTGTVTITHSATLRGCEWSIVQFTGMATSGTHGSDAIAQSATDRVDTASGLTVTLAALASASHVGAAGFFSGTFGGHAPGTGWTELGDFSFTTPNRDISSQWNTTGDTTADATGSSSTWGGIAVEIAAVAAAVAPVVALVNRGLNAPLQAGIN